MLRSLGCDAVHTLDLPAGNRTPDHEICVVADRDERIVVTKDRDFRNSHLLLGRPRLLLHVTTGNITNADLLALIVRSVGEIERAFEVGDYVELSAEGLIAHTREA